MSGFRAFRASVLPTVHNQAGGFVYEHEVLLRAVQARLKLAAVPVRTQVSTRSHVTPAEILRANNHFDRWVLLALPGLPISLWRKLALALGCAAGLCLGLPAAWLLRRRPPVSPPVPALPPRAS